MHPGQKEEIARIKKRNLMNENLNLLQRIRKIAWEPQDYHPNYHYPQNHDKARQILKTGFKASKMEKENKKMATRILSAKPSRALSVTNLKQQFKKNRRAFKSMRKIDKDHFVQARRYSPNSKAKMYSRAVKPPKSKASSFKRSR